MSISRRTAVLLVISILLGACAKTRAGDGDVNVTVAPATQNITNAPLKVDGGNLTLTDGEDFKLTNEGLKTLNWNVTLNTEKVKATYLGLETTAADETLRAQLKLPAGVGLAIKHVEGPAKEAGALQHDVLWKINEQLIINTEQFRVLVRTFKPGDKVELTIIREAQPVKLTATLVEKEVEALSAPSTYQLYNSPADQKALQYFKTQTQPAK